MRRRLLDCFRMPSIKRALGRRSRRSDPRTLDSSLEKFDFIYPVQAHFGGGPIHRVTFEAGIDVDRLCREQATSMLRSDIRTSRDGEWEWGYVLFHFGRSTFVYVSFTSDPDDSRNYIAGEKACIVIHADSPATAKERAAWLKSQYARRDKEIGPAYFLLKVRFGGFLPPEPVPLADSAGSQDLAIHYGEEFSSWADGFFRLLSGEDHGLTILRGEPGTGKSFFIRHLIRRFHGSHRFFFLPLKEFAWLADPQFIEFWNGERKAHPNRQRVIILEDAEALLMARDQDNRSSVATLLNIADGLLGDFLKLHAICTINGRLDAIDPAIVRPGRLMAMREFGPLSSEDSQRLAESLGVILPERREFTLGELYNLHSRSLVKQPSRKHAIGFANG